MVRNGPRPIVEVGADYWIALSGVPSPDMNTSLVSSRSTGVVARVLEQVEEAGVPSLFMLAGACRSEELAGPWQHVGEMPFMASDLEAGNLGADPRVRQAGSQDLDVVCALMGDAFGLAVELIVEVTAGVLRDDNGPTKILVLEEEGVAVSAVLTSFVDDAVTVWCMSTPERFARRGYGRAILADCLLRARSDGARVGLLGATPAGKPLYDATGWITLEYWRLFASAESVQFDA
jgi:N-acetylglutamate synthase-like GNAT family acetyltransferase